MVDVALLVAVALLIVGVVGSIVPLAPGPPVSVVAVLGYWAYSGFSEPSAFTVVGLVLVGVVAFSADFLASAVSAKAGGASWGVSAIASVVGIALLLVTGPLGMILGVAVAVFLLELRRHQDVRRGLRTAAATTIGILGGTAVQALLTFGMLIGFVLAVT
ncbi:DUF456 domain-containing protein [Natronoarchaeum rubrum]|uniref:DUF456 domain-containing protein n=1 Tax=Natronoarchaeum rubrum TaxID=755311 RepID=UPI0021113861|nr:DUF456 domain-containing protein [Natronoarchaeum rubrum]